MLKTTILLVVLSGGGYAAYYAGRLSPLPVAPAAPTKPAGWTSRQWCEATLHKEQLCFEPIEPAMWEFRAAQCANDIDHADSRRQGEMRAAMRYMIDAPCPAHAKGNKGRK